MKELYSRLTRGGSAIAIALTLAGMSQTARAQDADTITTPAEADAPADEQPAGAEIVVTGSRLGRSSFNSPTPVNVLNEDRMKNLAIPTVAEALNQLPSFRALTTPTSALFRVNGSVAANSVDLRGLGTSRTLVLVDGRRFVPSSDNGTVDLNGIPSALVKRTEVVTGGASAAYGANAVAGVVNLILDTDFEGIKADANYGISEQGDDENFFVSLAGGTSFGGGRGHIIAGAEYHKNYGVGPCETRDWCSRYTNYISNPGFINGVSTNGLPRTIVADDVRFVYNRTGILIGATTTGGTVLGQQVNSANMLNPGLQGLQFNNDASSLVPFNFGNYLSGIFMQGGDPSVDALFGFGDVPLRVPSSHFSSMVHAEYEVTDSVEMFGEMMYSNVKGGPAVSSYLTRTTTLDINNPYIQQSVRDQILAVNPDIASITVNSVSYETGPQVIGSSENNIWRGVVGFRGSVFDGWNWDVSYVHGETHNDNPIRENRIKRIETEAPDAITPPSGYGGPVYSTPEGLPVICRSSVANPGNGCIPINYLGLNSISQQALDFYFADAYQTRTIKQDAAAVNLRGELGDLWAGPISFAVGAEWRKDTAVGDADPLSLSGAFTAGQATALPFIKQTVVEGYIEAGLPIIRDMLTIDGALRQTHYNEAGNATTWKGGVVFEPTDDILIRVTRSRDIRAPSPAELNPNFTVTNLPLPDPFGGGTHTILNVTGGNPNLGLEKGDTFTAGLVLTPSFVPGFRFSVDYYKIDLKGGIDALSAPAVLNACYLEDRLCDLIEFSGAPQASPADTVYSNFQNLSTINAEGLEFVSQYSLPVGAGDLNLSVNANYVIKLQTIDATGLVTKLDGVTGNAGSLTNTLGVPTYKIDAVLTYEMPTWSLTAHGRYVPKSILDPNKVGPDDPSYDINLPNSVSINTVSPAFYLDLTAKIDTGIKVLGSQNVELYGGVFNALDKTPPRELRFFGNPLHYDVVGRAYRIGVRTGF